MFFPIFADKGIQKEGDRDPSTIEQRDAFYAGYLGTMHLCPPA
jgi:hypothetical protein